MPLSADSSAYANRSDLTQISAEKKAVKIVIISATSTATSATHTKKRENSTEVCAKRPVRLYSCLEFLNISQLLFLGLHYITAS